VRVASDGWNTVMNAGGRPRGGGGREASLSRWDSVGLQAEPRKLGLPPPKGHFTRLDSLSIECSANKDTTWNRESMGTGWGPVGGGASGRPGTRRCMRSFSASSSSVWIPLAPAAAVDTPGGGGGRTGGVAGTVMGRG